MNVSTIHSKAVFIATLNPKAWEVVGGGPGGRFAFSNAHVELFVADAVKSVASSLSNRGLGEKVLSLSRKMATQATQGILAWEPGDEICPPWPWPWPGPRPWQTSDFVRGPQPEPWKQIGGAEQIGLAYVLTELSGLTTNKEFNAELKSLATEIARDASKTLVEDFERCGTVPRKPFPKPRPA